MFILKKYKTYLGQLKYKNKHDLHKCHTKFIQGHKVSHNMASNARHLDENGTVCRPRTPQCQWPCPLKHMREESTTKRCEIITLNILFKLFCDGTYMNIVISTAHGY